MALGEFPQSLQADCGTVAAADHDGLCNTFFTSSLVVSLFEFPSKSAGDGTAPVIGTPATRAMSSKGSSGRAPCVMTGSVTVSPLA